MDYRTLGRSGCSVSAMCLGTMTFGAETPEAEAHSQLDLFLEAGGTLVDTADVYSSGMSEEIIGRWFGSRPAEVRDRVVLATKGRFPMGQEPNALGNSRRHLRRALDASLTRLGVDHVDLYQLHAWDPVTPLEETLRFLDDAVSAGKIGYPGLSNFTGWQVQKAVDLAERDHLAVPVTLQPSYSLLVRGIEHEIVAACLHNGLGLLPWGPLAGGWLSGKYTRDQRPTGRTRLGEDPGRGMEAYDRVGARERTWDVLGVVQDVADAHGVPMAQVALAWLIDRPAVTSVILGARTVAQLRDNLDAAALRLTVEQLARLDAVSDPGAPDYPYGDIGTGQHRRDLAGAP
jgi:aryl-alcohol dehydrogenase-like predicted oxidoreductase